jgi:hypothetical protein
MTVFQLVALPISVLLAVRSGARLLRGERPRVRAAFGAVLWTAASVAILIPDLTTDVANVLGIGRGTDLITYLVALGFFWSWFYFNQKIARNSTHLTELCRTIAVEHALQQYPPFDRPPAARSAPKLVD